jgi:serine/threonine-protein kinase
VVAIKRMLPRLARDPTSRDVRGGSAARLAGAAPERFHPRRADEEGQIAIVMDYVNGAPLSTLPTRSLKADKLVPVPIVANIACAMLAGLHAAHEARDRRGRSLGS